MGWFIIVLPTLCSIYVHNIFGPRRIESFSHVRLGELSRGWGICHLMWKGLEGQRDLTADKVNPL